jgi:hypothetical protein
MQGQCQTDESLILLVFFTGHPKIVAMERQMSPGQRQILPVA